MPDELESISPIDGRYRNKTAELAPYFSELGLIKYRLLVEIRYLLYLKELDLPQLKSMSTDKIKVIEQSVIDLSIEDAEQIKKIESVTNHDVKAVEYFLKEKLTSVGLHNYVEFVHFGLTSQDINNTAIPLSLKEGMAEVMYPLMLDLVETLTQMERVYEHVSMLARTHGQPASPTMLGKEIGVFRSRLNDQLPLLYAVPFRAKFGGATGNFNAHVVAYPEIDWHKAAKTFVEEKLGLSRTHPTTQIEPYDMLAAHCHGFMRFNTICLDLCRDIWTYISMDYFTQKVVANEVGSSAMPHKVNPIDFENAEGNLGVANALFSHLAEKLPISRLQRDLSDSTVLRNIGVPLSHSLIAYKSILKGISRLEVNRQKIKSDLNGQWAVLSEAIQTILRREGFERPYELLKSLSRGNRAIDKEAIHHFISTLDISDEVKSELYTLTPLNYVGK